MKELEFKPIPDYGDLMTIESFREDVKSGGFIDYDGHGYLSDGKQISNMFIIPSKFKKNLTCIYDILTKWEDLKWQNIPKWATHIVWFNK